MNSTKLRVNSARLRSELDELAQIGRVDGRGIYRMAFSEADMKGRAWFRHKAEQAGLELYQDGAANLFARHNWNPDVPGVISGSHMDTVPGAGHLDGALGVVCALEAVRCISEAGVELNRPLEAAAFSDEEGRFGGLFGSQALAGLVTPEYIQNSVDLDGISLTEAMAAHGLDVQQALYAQRSPGSIHGYVELHIEQGPVLDRQGIPVAVVDAITGLFKWEVTLTGVANHAGTTPMDMRSDAFAGVAEFSTQIERIIEEFGSPHSTATIGRVELMPGAANVVPGKAQFSLDVRDTSERTLEKLGEAFRRTLSVLSSRRGLMFEYNVLSEIAPVQCAASVIQAIEQACSELDIRSTHMHSGAAHDAQIVASVAPAGMIFVPSKEGRSHSAAEWTAWDDIEAGANTLLQTLINLAE